MVNNHNKNQKKEIVVKGKGIVKKFNDKCFIYNKIEHQVMNGRNRTQ
jgi:hypothetical protein